MDDGTTVLTRIIYWYMTNKRRFYTLVIIGVLLVVGLVFYTNNAFVYVNISASFPVKNATVYAASAAPTQKVGGAGLVVVPRSTSSLIVAGSDYIKTETKIDIPWYGFAEKTVQLKQDLSASKVAYTSTLGTTCATYSTDLNRLAYYSCSNPKSLVTYQTPPTGSWGTQLLASLYLPSAHTAPYMGGIIGIGDSSAVAGDASDTGASSSNITIVSGTGKTATYLPPSDVNLDDFYHAQVFANTYNPQDNRFVAVTVNGDIYISTPSSGNLVDYHHIQPPQNYSTDYNQTLCAFDRDVVYCYRGKTAYGDVPDNFDFSKFAGSQIVTYSFTSNSEITTKVTDDLYALDNFQVTAGGDLYATYHKQLYRFDKKGDSYDPVTVSQNADAIAGGDKLYFVQGKGVYAVDDKDKYTSYQVFYSPNVIAKALYAVSGKVFVIGKTPSNDKTTYAYLLENTPNNNPGKRLIDFFPAAADKFADVTSNDLVGDRLYFELKLTPYRSDLHPITNIDPGDVALKKDNVLSIVRSLGLPIDEQKIQFTY